MKLSFLKYHSLGNDFILVAGNQFLPPELAQALCDRQRGIGADGILIHTQPSANQTIHALVQNADGSDGNFSGNGLRCLAHHFLKNQDAASVTIVMANKPMICTKKNTDIITTIPRGTCQEKVEIPHGNKTLIGYRVDVGNPHLIIFENVHRSWLEQHGLFFARYGGLYANVTFATQQNNVLFALTFERGVGFTQSCSSAAAALTTLCAHRDAVSEASYTIEMPGGAVATTIDAHSIRLSAPAYQVFEGNFFSQALLESYKSAYRN